MKTILAGLLFVGLLSPAFGQLTDTFGTTTSNWDTPAATPVGPPSMGSSSVSLAQDNNTNRMDWQVTLAGASNSDNLFRPLQSYDGTYDSDWSISFDIVNSFSAGTGQSVQIGLMAFNSSGLADDATADYLKLVLVQADPTYNGGLADGNVIHYGSHSNMAPDPYSTSTGIGSIAELSLTYTAATHTLAAYHGATILRTFGIAGSGGDSFQDWGMISGDLFTVGLYAQASTSSAGAGFTLPAGIAYADTFTSTGLGAAVPEPSNYVAFTGLAVFGLTVIRRRRTV